MTEWADIIVVICARRAICRNLRAAGAADDIVDVAASGDILQHGVVHILKFFCTKLFRVFHLLPEFLLQTSTEGLSDSFPGAA